MNRATDGQHSPRVLLADTTRWSGTAQLALEFSKVGVEVAVTCPERHPILKAHERFRTFPYSPFHSEQSLAAAIEHFQPQFLVPCDERAAYHLRGLHSRAIVAGPKYAPLSALIEESLGNPAHYSTIASRHSFLELAHQEGLRVPDSRPLESLNDLRLWQRLHPFPWVLKADGTWGGGGVKVVYNARQAAQAYSALCRLFNLRRVISKICMARDLFLIRPWWNGERPSITVQSHIDGRPANCGFACSNGKVTACISVEAIGTLYETGPSTVVRVVDNREMLMAAEKIASRLELAGFVGLDFMIDKEGAAHLIEINPRCTPVSHLRLGPGKDLIEALRAKLTATEPRMTPGITNRSLIAYFPQAWESERALPHDCFRDIPEHEPELVNELLHPWPSQTLLSRAARSLFGMKMQTGGIPIEPYEESPPTGEDDKARVANCRAEDGVTAQLR